LGIWQVGQKDTDEFPSSHWAKALYFVFIFCSKAKSTIWRCWL